MKLYTVKEVAEHLQVDPKTIYEWVWAGHIPHKRLGPTGRTIRISETDLAKYLASVQHT